MLPYLKRTLNLVDVEVLSIQGALAQVEAGKAGYSWMIAESPEPRQGSPGFELRGQVDIVIYTFYGGKRLLSLSSSFFSLVSKWLEKIDGMLLFEIEVDINENVGDSS